MNNNEIIPIISKEALKTIAPDDLGRTLQGFGVNLLVKDALIYTESLSKVLGVEVIRAEQAFALITTSFRSLSSDDVAISHLIQIHADFTYHNNPYHAHLPELGARGNGVELHLFETHPDVLAAKAEADSDWTVLQIPTDKPHGVRESYLLDMHGYCWVVSTPLVKSS